MKINKLFSALMGGALLLGMAACTDEVVYTPAEKIPGNCVFFPVDESSVIAITQDATTCELYICRENSEKDLTVELEGQVTDEYGTPLTSTFTVPSQVTFPAGVSRVPVVIDVVFDDIVPEYEYLLNLKILGEDNSPYGLTERQFVLTYAPWTDWMPYRYYEDTGAMVPLTTPDYETTGTTGLGTINDVQLHDMVVELPIYVRGSMVNANKFQIGVPDPYLYDYYRSDFESDPDLNPMEEFDPYNYILTIDKTWTCDVDGEKMPIVILPVTPTLYTASGEPLYMMDLMTWYTEYMYAGAYTIEFIYENLMVYNGLTPSYFDESKGLIAVDVALSIPSLIGTTSYYGHDWNYIQLPGFKDYSITMVYTGNFVDTNGKETAQVSAYKGTDANSYAYKCVAGALTDEQVAAVAQEIQADVNAELVYDDVATLSFQLENDGPYTVVAVSYNAAGIAVSTSSYTFNYKTVQAEREWVSVGTCRYSEGIIYGHWSISSTGEEIGGEEWDVEVEANIKTPGLYRMVNPYASWPFALTYASYGIAMTDQDYYIYFNALYDNGTYMIDGPLGVTLKPLGLDVLTFETDCYYYLSQGYSLEDMAKYGFTGTVEDGVVGFPAGTFGLYSGNSGYYSNFSDELLDALENWTGSDSFWYTVPDPAYGMGYTTIDMSGVTGEYAPGQQHLNVSAGVKKHLNKRSTKATYKKVESVKLTGSTKAPVTKGYKAAIVKKESAKSGKLQAVKNLYNL